MVERECSTALRSPTDQLKDITMTACSDYTLQMPPAQNSLNHLPDVLRLDETLHTCFWVDSVSSLHAMRAAFADCRTYFLAVDTEWRSSPSNSSDADNLALIQLAVADNDVAGASACWLVDVCAGDSDPAFSKELRQLLRFNLVGVEVGQTPFPISMAYHQQVVCET